MALTGPRLCCFSVFRSLKSRQCCYSTHTASSTIATNDGPVDLSPFINDFELVLDHPKFFVLNKSAGIGIQDDSKTVRDEEWRKGIAAVLADLDPLIKSVHRLDKNVTGGVVFAKDSRTASMISRNLRLGGNSGYSFTRRYIGLFRQGAFEDLPESVGLEDKTAATITSTDEKGSFEETKITISDTVSDGYQAAVIQLSTGRKHQIRRHFSQILKRPLLNDTRYLGDAFSQEENAIALHSAYISLKVGLKEVSALVPVKYSRDLWRGFTNDKGYFNDEVKDLLCNFDQRFKERS